MAERGGREALLDAVTSMSQMDPTTCGATCVLAARLLEGAGRITDPVRSQRAIQRGLNRRAILWLLPWPRALGSPPWALARELSRMTGRRYRVRWVRDSGRAFPGVVERARGHLAEGRPVILLTGGPLLRRPAGGARRSGLNRLGARVVAGPAIPRHYVLGLPWDGGRAGDPGRGRIRVYEPGRGRLHDLDLADLGSVGERGAMPALGHWSRVLAVILPAQCDRCDRCGRPG